MNRLKNFKKYSTFLNESSAATRAGISSSPDNFRKFEQDAKKYNLDLEDENIQKIICDEIIKKIEKSSDTLDLRINLSEIAKKVSVSAPSPSSPSPSSPSPSASARSDYQNESKIFENITDSKKSFSDLAKKFQEIDQLDLQEMEILKHIDSSTLSEEKNEEEAIESTKAGIKWLRENKFSKFALNGICGILQILSYIPNFILRLANNVFNWFLRNVFGLSHEMTSKIGTVVLPLICMCVIVIVFLPLVSAGISIVSGISIVTAFSGFSLSGLASTGFIIRGVWRTIKGLLQMHTLEPKEEIFTFLEFLDELEKIAPKKIKIDLDTRSTIEQLDKTIGLEYYRAVNFFYPEEISNFLKKEIEKIRKITQESGFHRVKIGFPVFDKIIENKKPTQEDFDKLMDLFTKKDPENERIYRYSKSSKKLESKNNFLLKFKNFYIRKG